MAESTLKQYTNEYGRTVAGIPISDSKMLLLYDAGACMKVVDLALYTDCEDVEDDVELIEEYAAKVTSWINGYWEDR